MVYWKKIIEWKSSDHGWQRLYNYQKLEFLNVELTLNSFIPQLQGSFNWSGSERRQSKSFVQIHVDKGTRKKNKHSVKRVHISLYSVRMRENPGKMRTRITPNTDSFYAVKETRIKKLKVLNYTPLTLHGSINQIWTNSCMLCNFLAPFIQKNLAKKNEELEEIWKTRVLYLFIYLFIHLFIYFFWVSGNLFQLQKQ